MSVNGGIYGDYGLCKSTRILEKRKYTENIYNRRLFNAQGGGCNYFLFGLTFGLSVNFLNCFKNVFASNNPKIIIYGGSFLFSYFIYSLGPSFLGDKKELKYLKANKAQILDEITSCQIADYNERMGIFPEIPSEENKVEETIVSDTTEGEASNES